MRKLSYRHNIPFPPEKSVVFLLKKSLRFIACRKFRTQVAVKEHGSFPVLAWVTRCDLSSTVNLWRALWWGEGLEWELKLTLPWWIRIKFVSEETKELDSLIQIKDLHRYATQRLSLLRYPINECVDSSSFINCLKEHWFKSNWIFFHSSF